MFAPVIDFCTHHSWPSYEVPNRPVILTGLMGNWPLYRQLADWTQRVQSMRFKVGQHEMVWSDFMHYANDAIDEDPLYLFDKHYTRRFPEFASMYTVVRGVVSGVASGC